MSTPAAVPVPIVNQSDTIQIPLYDIENPPLPVHVEWKQHFVTRKAEYFLVKAKNTTGGRAGQEVPLFIAKEWYVPDASAGEVRHASRAWQKVDGEGDAKGYYEAKIHDNFQYGQKNEKGVARFLVYHDKERRPYQHRFVESAVQSAGLKLGQAIAGLFGYGSSAEVLGNIIKGVVGDYLHTFN